MSLEDPCIFCNIVAKKAPAHIVFEDDTCIAFLDIYPIAKGLLLLIPKEHYATIWETPPEILSSVIKHAAILSKAVKNSTKAEGISVWNANGRASDQVVNHLHFHFIPRYTDDNAIKVEFGQSLADEDELREMSKKIAALLE